MRHKSLYECMLGVHQWRSAFPGNIDFAADDQRIVMYYSSMKQSWNNIYETIGESRVISHSDDTEQQEQQEQQVAGNPLFPT